MRLPHGAEPATCHGLDGNRQTVTDIGTQQLFSGLGDTADHRAGRDLPGVLRDQGRGHLNEAQR